MGEVYRAYDPKISRDVAIKVLTAELAGASIIRETQAARAVNHPNIMTPYEVGTYAPE
jgi:serine/threonine protein kinase